MAKALGVPLLEWHIKSTTKAQQGLYEYDAVSRLRDSQLGDARVHDIHNYIVKGMLWQAFTADKPVVLLIDEIDKADIEFPNDLLRELDRMEFYVYETRELVKAKHRPIVFITSNNEKELPDAFLRRCFFHYIRFPDKETMEKIVEVHFPSLKKSLLREAMEVFFEVREVPGLKKKPSTSELLDWLKLLLAEDIPPEALQVEGPQDHHPAAARRAAQERAGRAPVRAAGVHDPRQGRLNSPVKRASAALLALAAGAAATVALPQQAAKPGPEDAGPQDSELRSIARDHHTRIELKRWLTSRGTPDESTRTIVRVDRLLDGPVALLRLDVSFPDEATDFNGDPFNPRLGDIKARVGFRALKSGQGVVPLLRGGHVSDRRSRDARHRQVPVGRRNAHAGPH